LHKNVETNMKAVTGIKWADMEKVDMSILEKRLTFFGEKKGLKTLKEAGIKFDKDENPINPNGLTGLRGRGLLGRHGPNHAADPIVCYKDENGELWAIVVRRKDTGQYAIPGGMVDPGNNITQTLTNELCEEAIEIIDASDDSDNSDNNMVELEFDLEKKFRKAITLYEGYVDDLRNTDNAWLETTVCGILIAEKDKKYFRLKKEDSEGNTDSTKWIKISANSSEFQDLYADHRVYLLLMKAAVDGMDYYSNIINDDNDDNNETNKNDQVDILAEYKYHKYDSNDVILVLTFLVIFLSMTIAFILNHH